MDTMTNELKVNSEFEVKISPVTLSDNGWTSHITVPLKPVQNDLVNRQYCSEPEPLIDQINKELEKKKDMIDDFQLVQEFVEKYPNAYKSYIEQQHRDLIAFIKGWNKE